MKALQSDLARKILADPTAASQLRTFLASKNGYASEAAPDQSKSLIRVNIGGKTAIYKVTVVPKAA